MASVLLAAIYEYGCFAKAIDDRISAAALVAIPTLQMTRVHVRGSSS